jgi:hypothetical protein
MPFSGIQGLRSADDQVLMTPYMIDEIRKCKKDPLYFARNYVYINTKDDGMQLFDARDYQEEMIDKFNKHRFNIALMCRQSGKSTVTRAYAIWYLLFNPEKVVCILGNKLSLAQEQLQQLKDSYIRLPLWMQPGVNSWSKRSVELCNNSRIMCAATSPDGIRGLSINLLILDEFAFIPSHKADDFIASVFPTISSGNTTKVIIISTPFGLNHFYNMWQKSGDTIEESQNKYVRTFVDWKRAGRSEEWAINEKNTIGDIRFNQEYACKFLGSASTLIESTILEKLSHCEPLKIDKLPPIINIFELPLDKRVMERNGWEYVASIDTGYGTKNDYSVMHIALVKNNLDVAQVLSLRCNYLDVSSFAKLARGLLSTYRDPSLIVESNGPGTQMVAMFHENFEYDNLIHFDKNNLGLFASDKKKSAAVILLKTYIEKGFLKVRDIHTIKELYTFGQKGNKWGSSAGSNDDCISAMYWILYFLNSPFFFGNEVDWDSIGNDDDDLQYIKNIKYQSDEPSESPKYGTFDSNGAYIDSNEFDEDDYADYDDDIDSN